ncbi:class I SAM-dependent methyltransferase [Mucilaginibacter sp.]
MTGKHNFSKHHQVVANQSLPPAKSLTFLLPYLQETASKTAVDLGCGAGIDTLYLLEQGWQVMAIDQSSDALKALRQIQSDKQLTTSCQTFEELQLPSAQLINASFALPFCKPENFDQCWTTIVNTLQEGGGFSGHFFGFKDSWTNRTNMTFFDKVKLDELFSGFDIKWFEETERDGKTLGGIPKHWHVYHVAALKL